MQTCWPCRKRSCRIVGLSKQLGEKLRGRVVVVGVGDSHRGDDGVGPLIAELLETEGIDGVIDAGTSPEIETWRIRELGPDTVLFVDAVDLGAEPGDSAILEPDDLRAKGFDTHRAPLKLTMGYLEQELGCQCLLLAVQPHDVRQEAPMCAQVKQTAQNLADVLAELI
jgi:hydrogenase 3 maturation protease